MEIDSADIRQPPNGEICMDKSHLLPNNPARQKNRYTSVQIEAANMQTANILLLFLKPLLLYFVSNFQAFDFFITVKKTITFSYPKCQKLFSRKLYKI